MRERLEKAIPQKNDGGERLEKARGRLEKSTPQKNDGGKGWKRPNGLVPQEEFIDRLQPEN